MKRTTVEECERISIFEIKQEGGLHQDGDDCLYGELTLPLTKTQCFFGGIRWWFICPKCEHRVGILYQPYYARDFLCRHCHKLTYTSSQERGTSLEPIAKHLRLLNRYIKLSDGLVEKKLSKRDLRQLNEAWKKIEKLPQLPTLRKCAIVRKILKRK